MRRRRRLLVQARRQHAAHSRRRLERVLGPVLHMLPGQADVRRGKMNYFNVLLETSHFISLLAKLDGICSASAASIAVTQCNLFNWSHHYPIQPLDVAAPAQRANCRARSRTRTRARTRARHDRVFSAPA